MLFSQVGPLYKHKRKTSKSFSFERTYTINCIKPSLVWQCFGWFLYVHLKILKFTRRKNTVICQFYILTPTVASPLNGSSKIDDVIKTGREAKKMSLTALKVSVRPIFQNSNKSSFVFALPEFYSFIFCSWMLRVLLQRNTAAIYCGLSFIFQ